VDGVWSATLIDEQTNTRTAISYPGCSGAVQLSGPWLMLFCGSSDGPFELYSLDTGEWRTVVPDPRVVSLDCGMPDYCGVFVAGAGAQWIQWAISRRDSRGTVLFQNIDTGEVRSLPGWRSGGRIIPNLDSPSLAQQLCPPLTVPSPRLLSFYGSFAIVDDPLLERCGSRLELAVGNDGVVQANSRAVVWPQGPNSRRLSGLFLPSLRRFVITTPSIPYPYGFLMSSGELYVITARAADGSGLVLATPAPTQSHRRPSAREHH
jgi:hypothetical protein